MTSGSLLVFFASAARYLTNLCGVTMTAMMDNHDEIHTYIAVNIETQG